MAELDSAELGVKGFSYTFFRYTYGPFTTELYEDGDALHVAGLITDKRGPIKLTSHGDSLLHQIEEVIRQNVDVCLLVENAAKKYAPLSFSELKRTVYARKIQWSGGEVAIGDIPMYAPVLSKLDETESDQKFQIGEDWLDSLWGALTYTEEEQIKSTRVSPYRAAVAV
jgi:hypothetical protein